MGPDKVQVLLALDTSDIGERAAAVIAAWARVMPIDVHLLSVIHAEEVHAQAERPSGDVVEPGAAGPGDFLAVGGSLYADAVGDPRLIADSAEMLARARSAREEYLRGVAERHFDASRAAVHVEFADETARCIVATAQSLGADAIAMATHGRSGIRHVVMGSVAEEVMRQAAVPVIVVGPRVQLART